MKVKGQDTDRHIDKADRQIDKVERTSKEGVDVRCLVSSVIMAQEF